MDSVRETLTTGALPSPGITTMVAAALDSLLVYKDK
jgi:hypothetical protein